MKINKSQQNIQNILDLADIKINGKQPSDIQVNNEQFYSRVLGGGSLALGESYMDGWWDSEQLDEFFAKALTMELDKKIISADLVLHIAKSKIINAQNKARSKKVAEQHYDLGNSFYAAMLDKRMQYTCAYWKDTDDLDIAQEQKLDLICRKINLTATDKVLELGCGWGGFAKYAAEKYGCSVTGYNISEEQVNYANDYCKGLPVSIIKADYREAQGEYDKVVSIGLCEHVGYKNYAQIMTVASNCLKDQGLFLLHTIGGLNSVTITDPWIEKYIFPNSMLPSIQQLARAAEGLFVIEDLHNFGADYDKTLMAWFENFEQNWPQYQEQYGDRFYRMWKYYLLACAGSFRARKNQLWQIVLSKNGVPGGYNSVR